MYTDGQLSFDEEVDPFDWLSSGEISSFPTFLTVLSPVNLSTLLSTSAALVFLGQHTSYVLCLVPNVACISGMFLGYSVRFIHAVSL
jgi:hypothetical protein